MIKNHISRNDIPEIVGHIGNMLIQHNFEAYLVGGCVRDTLIGKPPKDWDIATNATPEEIMAIFPDTFYENDYGTVGIVNDIDDETLKVVEVTPYRKEGKYSDNRRPDTVVWSKTIDEDLKRRDFTINALAYNLKTHEIKDDWNGLADLKDKTLRTVGNPEDRFGEDGLRIMRAIRLFAELGFAIDYETMTAISQKASILKDISAERIRDEFERIIRSPRPDEGLVLMQKLGVLKEIIPELEEGIGIGQNQAHAYTVWEHLLRTVEHSARKDYPFEVRLAALFHDIGKPRTRRKDTKKNDWSFHGHEVIGARMTKEILTRLKFPKDTVETVTKLVRWHMFFSDTEQITLSAVRRIIRNVGTDQIWNLMNVRACDRIGTGRPKESPYRLRKYHAMIDEVLTDPISVDMLKISGGEIMKILDIKPGPKIGWILHALLEEVIEDPLKNTPAYLHERIQTLAKLPDDELQKKGVDALKFKADEQEKQIKDIKKKHFVQ